MKSMRRYFGPLLLAAAVVSPALIATEANAQEATVQVRVYDRNPKDYHNWDDREDRSYRNYLSEQHKDYREVQQAKPQRARPLLELAPQSSRPRLNRKYTGKNRATDCQATAVLNRGGAVTVSGRRNYAVGFFPFRAKLGPALLGGFANLACSKAVDTRSLVRCKFAFFATLHKDMNSNQALGKRIRIDGGPGT
jgi:hypothetical protein